MIKLFAGEVSPACSIIYNFYFYKEDIRSEVK